MVSWTPPLGVFWALVTLFRVDSVSIRTGRFALLTIIRRARSTVRSLHQKTASVDGTDFICAMFCYLSQCLMDNGKQPTILARSLDLSSAYRQLTISEESKGFSFISVFSPVSGRAELFRQVALPFGSKAAVNAFIRCSRCIQWLAATILHIPLSCYFDDFVWPRPHHLPTTVKPRSQFF